MGYISLQLEASKWPYKFKCMWRRCCLVRERNTPCLSASCDGLYVMRKKNEQFPLIQSLLLRRRRL